MGGGGGGGAAAAAAAAAAASSWLWSVCAVLRVSSRWERALARSRPTGARHQEPMPRSRTTEPSAVSCLQCGSVSILVWRPETPHPTPFVLLGGLHISDLSSRKHHTR